jgi:hypothetical protein
MQQRNEILAKVRIILESSETILSIVGSIEPSTFVQMDAVRLQLAKILVDFSDQETVLTHICSISFT